MEALRVGLIGSGRIGRVHAASVSANDAAELVLVSDPDAASAEAVVRKYGGAVAGTPDEVIGSGRVDAVIIASPTPTHLDLVEACLDAGVPVLCEKPIDLDIRRVDALRGKVERTGVAVAVGFNQRFDPAFAEVGRRVAAGEIGNVEQLIIISRDPAPPPAAYLSVSGGIFRDMTIHDLDMARFMLGEIVEVSATGAQLFDDGAREVGDFDSAVVTLRAESGATATIINSRHSAIGYDQRLEAFGAEGLLTVSNAPSTLVRRSTAEGAETTDPYLAFFLERYSSAYELELAEFIRLVRGDPSSSPTFADGRAALVLADAAQRAASERVVVRLL